MLKENQHHHHHKRNINSSKNTTREEEHVQFNFPNFPKGVIDESQLSLYHSLLLASTTPTTPTTKQCTKCNHRSEHAHQVTEKPEPPTRSKIQNDCIKSIPRVNPLSSGVSLRSIPKATSADIINVCQFYLEKCEGKYSEKTRAYRMMTEMANEIIKLTTIIQRDFEVEYSKQREENIHLNKVCEEWNKYFGKDSSQQGDKYSKLNPSEIRLIIDKLESEVRKHEDALKEERLRHYEQERKLHLMINEHHEASRRSIRNIMIKQNSFSPGVPFQTNSANIDPSSHSHGQLLNRNNRQEQHEQEGFSLVESLLEENRKLKKQLEEIRTYSSTNNKRYGNENKNSTFTNINNTSNASSDSFNSCLSSSHIRNTLKYNTLFQ